MLHNKNWKCPGCQAVLWSKPKSKWKRGGWEQEKAAKRQQTYQTYQAYQPYFAAPKETDQEPLQPDHEPDGDSGAAIALLLGPALEALRKESEAGKQLPEHFQQLLQKLSPPEPAEAVPVKVDTWQDKSKRKKECEKRVLHLQSELAKCRANQSWFEEKLTKAKAKDEQLQIDLDEAEIEAEEASKTVKAHIEKPPAKEKAAGEEAQAGNPARAQQQTTTKRKDTAGDEDKMDTEEDGECYLNEAEKKQKEEWLQTQARAKRRRQEQQVTQQQTEKAKQQAATAAASASLLSG